MKKSTLVILLASAILSGSCKSEHDAASSDQMMLEQIEKSTKDFTDKSVAYRQFPAEVSFFPAETAPEKIPAEIQSRKLFIRQSGLPDESNVTEFKRTKSVQIAFDRYKNYMVHNAGSRYLPTFRQYGAWLILTRLDLLSLKERNDLSLIYGLINELVQSGYRGYQLISFGLKHLHENGFDKEKISALVQGALRNANAVTAAADSPSPAGVEKPLPPEIAASVKTYNDTKARNRQQAIAEMKQLLAEL